MEEPNEYLTSWCVVRARYLPQKPQSSTLKCYNFTLVPRQFIKYNQHRNVPPHRSQHKQKILDTYTNILLPILPQ